MQIKQLFDDDQAVSPVIGVILMVAITVILAAVIGTFVLGLGDQVQNNAPSAQIEFKYSGGSVDIVHGGGDTLQAGPLSYSVAGSTTDITGGPFSTGSTIVSGASVNSGDTVRLIWSNPNGQSSQILAESTAP